jgi:hypothetical protein
MSDRSEKPFELARDGLGILLFTAGAFLAVLVALALASSEPLEKAEGTAAIARVLAAGVGLLPAFLFSVGCALLGAQLFLSGDRGRARGIGKIAIVALAFSVLLGAFSRTAGGWVGDATSGAIARGTNVYVAALAGIVAIGAAAWFGWTRRTKSAESGPAEVSVGSAAASPDDGVSPEEAAELIPFDLPRSAADPRKVSHVTEASSPDTPVQREDVRLRAGIPEGTRPLSPSHEPAAVTTGSSPLSAPVEGLVEELDEGLDDELATPTVHERTPDPEAALAADGADEDLALEEEPFRLDDDEDAFELVEPEEELDLIEPSTRPFERVEIETESIALEPRPEEIEVAPEALRPEPDELEPEPVADVANVPRPSWEQTSLFDVEEEPAVDAYGTPLETSEEARQVLLQELETANETLATEIHLEASSEDDDPETQDVVLTPVPPKRKRAKIRDPKPASERPPKPANDRSRLLAEIGCLLLERGRVAVSMLQKQYDMDFDEATRVLDELQELGLIGPYLGGQRRDILLTRDEWLEKVSSL